MDLRYILRDIPGDDAAPADQQPALGDAGGIDAAPGRRGDRGVGDNGRVHLGGRYFGHRPDLYLRGAIVPASEGDSGLYHAAMYQPLPGASLATSEVRVSGVCRADLGPVTVALGSVTQETPCVTAIGEGFVAYKASFFDTTIQHAGGPGNIGLGGRQQGGPGGSPYEHEISIYFSP